MNFENKLTVLDVSNNLLSGDLGHCWIHWQNLMHLNLGRNNLSGEIPNPIGFLSELESLLLDDNDFYGSIPSTLQNCSMKFIDLGNNKLSDTLPSWIWEMQYLMVLRLRSNEFKGCITQKMCQLSSLIVLDIANNSLSGTIPNCLNEMKTLAGEDDFFANPLKYFYGFGFNYNNYKESLVLVPKGDELEYRDNLILVRMIDLSSFFNTSDFYIGMGVGFAAGFWGKPKVIAIKESRNLNTLDITVLFGKLKEHEHEMTRLKVSEKNVKKKEKKFIALKASSSKVTFMVQ
ncbi:receptor-like protein [Medicago truncatula]|uniref:Receptor-like protein n=1 Tax=Medicago truncatula TaxID=3880 RepID=A0A072TW42_MEDTR|nr:receptor-like protein [Medicago truncatula]